MSELPTDGVPMGRAHSHEPGDGVHDECWAALSVLQEFLHAELSDLQADQIRMHLEACEQCLEKFDVEFTIGSLVRRCQPTLTASARLRMRVMKCSITMTEPPYSI